MELKTHVAVTATFIVAVAGMVYVFKQEPTRQEIDAVIDQYGCKPTNEFVGKNGDRLYLCADGLKYKYEGFRQLAHRLKKSS